MIKQIRIRNSWIVGSLLGLIVSEKVAVFSAPTMRIGSVRGAWLLKDAQILTGEWITKFVTVCSTYRQSSRSPRLYGADEVPFGAVKLRQWMRKFDVRNRCINDCTILAARSASEKP